MTQNLTTTTANQPPTNPTRAALDLLARYRNAIVRKDKGGYSICERLAPTGNDRKALEARRHELQASVASADPRSVAPRVAKLFLRFPASRVPDAEATVAAYATDLARFPLWAIDAAMVSVIKGGSGGCAAFMPSSVELQLACEREFIKRAGEYFELCNVLNAEVIRELPADHRQRMMDGWDQLKAEFGAQTIGKRIEAKEQGGR